MLFKILVCILIFFTGAAAGRLKAKTYDNRIYHLQELISLLKVLESEMKYRLDPLPDLLIRVSGIKDGMCAVFFETAGRLMKNQTGRDLADCWKEAVETAFHESALRNEDKRILIDMSIELGKTDMENQSSLFRRTFMLLEAQESEAAEEKKTKGRMYKSLGTAIGLLIIIVLI